MTDKFPEIKANAREIVRRIHAGETRNEWYAILCRACRDIRKNEAFYRMHRIDSKLVGCVICRKT